MYGRNYNFLLWIGEWEIIYILCFQTGRQQGPKMKQNMIYVDSINRNDGL